MKYSRSIQKSCILLMLLLLLFSVVGCASSNSSEIESEIEEVTKRYEDEIEKYKQAISELQSENSSLVAEIEQTRKEHEEQIKKLEQELSDTVSNNAKRTLTFNIDEIPEFKGDATVIVNGGIPFFTDEDLQTTGEVYSDLDNKGRCGVCIALVGPDTLPTESRGSIGDIKPSGWDTVKYDGIDGNYLYNRCHLIGWQLTGENANPKNLITGTRYMNTQGMEPIEKKVANYVGSTGHHVLYRSTPVFEGDNLLASGVLLEAKSIEDDQIRLNVYCYNVQPDVIIEYSTGKSHGPLFIGSEAGSTEEVEVTRQQEAVAKEDTLINEEPEQSKEEEAEPIITYVGNSNSYKFHIPNCSSVSDMKDRNKVFFYGDRQEVIDAGYEPCKRCKP